MSSLPLAHIDLREDIRLDLKITQSSKSAL